MKTLKIGVMLLALLLAAMIMVPMASAADSAAQGDNSDQKIVSLYQPIHNEIQSNVSTAINERITTHDQYYKDLSSSLVKKYQTNLDSIIDILETKTGQQLSAKQRDTVKQIIVAEDLNKVVQENRKKELGVNATQMRTLQVQPDNVQMKSSNLQLTALPDSLTLIQVAVDVNGGTGRDGNNIPYTVNGGNQLYSIIYNTHPGSYTYYECHFRDEDVPDSASSDAIYDQYRLAVYGTIEDTQSFIVYSNGTIEFGSNWDNGYTYGYIIGQHGSITRPFGSSTRIYLSNVWNHAMDIYDRNSNMAKITYSY
ncbi:MAG: hypothetical protein ACLQMU_03505 [Methanoregula sp.]|uniref:hypothetical protein n=1 Tax=Methanoregula sp. TaxID=2052170 RepID=UPI003C39E022